MAEEPRQEAERIVFQVGSGRKQAQRFHESEDEFLRRRNALVDFLAAAIEETDAEDALRGHALRDQASVEKNRRLAQATEARRAALSALRGNQDG